MDGDLKKDLKGVKDNIKTKIWEKIVEFNVTKLDDFVKQDLGKLRKNILGLAEHDGGKSLAQGQLDALSSSNQKKELDKLAGNDDGSIQKAVSQLENKFKQEIQSPLSNAVGEVGTAIEKLGGKFENGAVKTMDSILDIFENIKDKVKEIKGKKNSSGLEGIAHGLINSYADTFKKNFESIVSGWAEGILGNDKGNDAKPPKKWLPKYVKLRGGDLGNSDVTGVSLILEVRNGIEEAIGKTLGAEIEAGKAQVISGMQAANASIQKTIASVKSACETFADKLDNRLKGGIDTLAAEIYGGIKDKVNNGKDKEIKLVTEATLLGLSATTSQVASEIESILLGDYRIAKGSGKSIASELDRVVGETQKLHDQLATATTPDASSDPNDSPARAVDSRLQAVRSEVGRIDKTFKDEVKKDLQLAVDGLEPAVNGFNTEAQSQIKAAAKAAEQIMRANVQVD
ncbi:Extracellular matrix-binding ebh, putative [Babesia ovata]|uniref:Extracellular matrix-binding ebh, putative n=1 Tax=Babesia ovata TaxID=189622 RepID=A0A2H6KDL7_9APIC|nr:Extracellular matrix-binding ebh, putative [Babesia ovata]GBE61092.1 Extracellular matrix-binding ebh, putative [Babesia ovata]